MQKYCVTDVCRIYSGEALNVGQLKMHFIGAFLLFLSKTTFGSRAGTPNTGPLFTLPSPSTGPSILAVEEFKFGSLTWHSSWIYIVM